MPGLKAYPQCGCLLRAPRRAAAWLLAAMRSCLPHGAWARHGVGRRALLGSSGSGSDTDLSNWTPHLVPAWRRPLSRISEAPEEWQLHSPRTHIIAPHEGDLMALLPSKRL